VSLFGSRCNLPPDSAIAEDRWRKRGHVIEPLAHRRAATFELGAKEVFPNGGRVRQPSGHSHPLVIEATNSPFGLRDTMRASRIGGRSFSRAFQTAPPTAS
jgi:hypothetical protein